MSFPTGPDIVRLLVRYRQASFGRLLDDLMRQDPEFAARLIHILASTGDYDAGLHIHAPPLPPTAVQRVGTLVISPSETVARNKDHARGYIPQANLYYDRGIYAIPAPLPLEPWTAPRSWMVQTPRTA